MAKGKVIEDEIAHERGRLIVQLAALITPHLENYRRDLLEASGGAIPADCHWHHLYDLPKQGVIDLLRQLIAAWLPTLRTKTVSHDLAIELLRASDPDVSLAGDIHALVSDRVAAGWQIYGVLKFITSNLACLSLHRCTMRRLVCMAARGDDDAFFAAFRIDKMVRYCRTLQPRLYRAEVEGDAKFRLRLSHHEKERGSSGRKTESYNPVRLALYDLETSGKLDGMKTWHIVTMVRTSGAGIAEEGESLRAMIDRARNTFRTNRSSLAS